MWIFPKYSVLQGEGWGFLVLHGSMLNLLPVENSSDLIKASPWSKSLMTLVLKKNPNYKYFLQNCICAKFSWHKDHQTLCVISKPYSDNYNGEFLSWTSFTIKYTMKRKQLWIFWFSIFLWTKNVMLLKTIKSEEVLWRCFKAVMRSMRKRVRSKSMCGMGHDQRLLSLTPALYLCSTSGKFPNVPLCSVDRSGGVVRGHRP